MNYKSSKYSNKDNYKFEIPETVVKEVRKVAEIIRKGGVILYPADTVWGIGCDATNEKAVKRIYDIKKREDNKSMLVLVNDVKMVEKYVKKVPKTAKQIINLATKPTTVIYSDAVALANNIIAEDGSIGIRVCKELFCSQLIRTLKIPIVSTSANISGEPTPKSFAHISEEIKKAVDYVVEWKQKSKKKAKPSSIIKIGNDNTVKIIRE